MKYAKWMLALSLVALSTLSVAQTITSSGLVAEVPFVFMVGNQSIPAGEVQITRSGMTPNILLVRNADAKAATLSNATQGETRHASNDTVLVFERYGDRYFLSSIRLGGSDMTYQFPQSKAEAELRAQNMQGTETTLLAALN